MRLTCTSFISIYKDSSVFQTVGSDLVFIGIISALRSILSGLGLGLRLFIFKGIFISTQTQDPNVFPLVRLKNTDVCRGIIVNGNIGSMIVLRIQ